MHFTPVSPIQPYTGIDNHLLPAYSPQHSQSSTAPPQPQRGYSSYSVHHHSSHPSSLSPSPSFIHANLHLSTQTLFTYPTFFILPFPSPIHTNPLSFISTLLSHNSFLFIHPNSLPHLCESPPPVHPNFSHLNAPPAVTTSYCDLTLSDTKYKEIRHMPLP